MTTAGLVADAPGAADPRRRGLHAGALAMAPLAAGYLPFALVVGAAAGAGPDALAAWAGSVLLFGGSAQLLVTELVRSGSGVWPALVAALVVNVRLLVFSTTLAPLWRGSSVWARLLAAAVVIDPVWALSSRREEQGGPTRDRRLFYAGAGGLLLVVWPLAVGAGAVLGRSPLAAGSVTASLLQMCLPASLAGVVGPYLRTSAGARAVLAAGVVAWVSQGWPPGTGILAAMAAGAVAGWAPGRSGGTP